MSWAWLLSRGAFALDRRLSVPAVGSFRGRGLHPASVLLGGLHDGAGRRALPRSPLNLGLVAVSLLLAIKGLPRAEWLYGAVGAFAVASYWKWLESIGAVPLVAVVLLVAFGLWFLAVLVRLASRHSAGS